MAARRDHFLIENRGLCVNDTTRSSRRQEPLVGAGRARVGRASGDILPVVLGALVATGCAPTVKVQAPDKPIEINVNVKIDQEVRIKLDREVERTIQDNPELFGTGVKR